MHHFTVLALFLIRENNAGSVPKLNEQVMTMMKEIVRWDDEKHDSDSDELVLRNREIKDNMVSPACTSSFNKWMLNTGALWKARKSNNR